MSKLEDATLAATGKELNEGKQNNLTAGFGVTKGSDGKFSLVPNPQFMKFVDDVLTPVTSTSITSTSTTNPLDSTAGMTLVNQLKRRKIAITGQEDLINKVKAGDTLYIERLDHYTGDGSIVGLCGQVTQARSYSNYYEIQLNHVAGTYWGYYSKWATPIISHAEVQINYYGNTIEAHITFLGFETDEDGHKIWTTAREYSGTLDTNKRECTGYIIRPPMATGTNETNEEGVDNE